MHELTCTSFFKYALRALRFFIIIALMIVMMMGVPTSASAICRISSLLAFLIFAAPASNCTGSFKRISLFTKSTSTKEAPPSAAIASSTYFCNLNQMYKISPKCSSTFPYEFLALAFNSTAQAGRLPKLLRLLRLAKLAKVLRASRIVKRMEQNTDVKYDIQRLIKFTSAAFLVTHWLACIFRICGSLGAQDEKNWLEVYEVEDRSVHTQYILALYWAVMTVTT